MPRKPNPPPDDAKQAARFIQTAKALEADKTGRAFEKALDLVVPVVKREKINPKTPKST